ncbi:E3 ubiquitin-protein ligase TRIM7-like [Onychostruthus taczanowskii]|uniref:E3 ubiquitin-protein ligase TRIM7-like n=1 Tax=Onychostruthus taczanowskii TaxID=356909 RepID=UPI001B80A6B9|nr:E3 ubiquitin-protein ligase TRIM7-like [Onychostruthus taczanowskii]
MAEEVLALREQLVAEATCPLCLDLFEQPVLTACGHSFCGQCLAGVLGNPPRPAACPQCRAPVEPGSLRPIRSLGNVAGLARSLEEVAARPRCPQHGKPLAQFCEPCAALLCALCRYEPEHRRHRVRPAEEAARELRETLQSNLLSLQEQKENLKCRGDQKSEDLQETLQSNLLSLQEQKENLKCRGDQKSEDLQTAVMWELQRVPETFEELQRCMEEKKKVLLAQLEQNFQELVNKSEEYTSRVLERQSLLDTVIAQIQEKRDQPAVEFLTDAGRILSSCEAAKAPIPEPVSPELQRSIESLSEKIQWVVDMVDRFKVSLQREIDWGVREQVRLDPETANPCLILSDDCKMVRFKTGKQNLPDTSKRFTGSLSVLGSQGFTSGRHYWEVEVGEEGCWALGVAMESVPRKESLDLHKFENVWALQLDWRGQYIAVCTTPDVLALREKLQRIRVCLDYEAGQVTFYNTEDMLQILQLEATFTEKVFPYFWVYSEKTQIQVCD